jgi:hypothetical protein
LCEIDSINIIKENSGIKSIFFIINDFSFEYQFENGFVNFVKSFNII